MALSALEFLADFDVFEHVVAQKKWEK